MCRKEGSLLDLGAIPYTQAVDRMEAASKARQATVDESLRG